MLNHGHIYKVTAIAALLLTVLATSPVSAADLKSPSPLGSVSTVGSVQLRGVHIAQDGTLFSGDQLQSAAKAYAKVVLLDGQKIELDANTDVTVGRQNDGIQVQMRSGNMAFTTTKATSFKIGAGSYEVTISKPSSGNIAIVGTDYMGLRLKAGTATVRNLKTKESFVVQSGQERLLGLQGYGEKQPLAQMASTLPLPIPAMPPAPQAAGSSSGLSRTGWIAVLATIGGAAVAVAVLSTRNNDEVSPADQLAQQKALGNLAAVQTTATAVAALATQTQVVAANANTASAAASNLTAAQRTQFTADAKTATDAASAANAKVALLSVTVAQLQGSVSTGLTAAGQASLNQALTDLDAARLQANAALQSLLTLLINLRNAGVANTPANPTNVAVPPPATASASIPV